MVSIRTARYFGAIALLILAVGCGPARDEPIGESAAASPDPVEEVAVPEALMAMAELTPREGTAISGSVHFKETADGVEITASVSGLEGAGSHGFHIHEIGDCSSADFKSSGGHFNPAGVPHAGPNDAEHHAGDLGNIEVGADGTGKLTISSDQLSVGPGANSVVGRAVVLHEGTDDLESQPTGAAGSRLACGVIAAL